MGGGKVRMLSSSKRVISIILITFLVVAVISPYGIASSDLYGEVSDKFDNMGIRFLEYGGFKIAPSLNEPTASFEALFNNESKKLVELYAYMESTFAPPTATKTYRTAAYQYWVTPSINEVNYIPAHTRP